MTILEHLRAAGQQERYLCDSDTCGAPLSQQMQQVGRGYAWLWTCPADSEHFERRRVSEAEYQRVERLFREMFDLEEWVAA